MAQHTCMNGNDCALCDDTMRRDFEREVYHRADLEDVTMAAELNQPASQRQSIQESVLEQDVAK